MSKQLDTIYDFYEWVKSRDPAETYCYYSPNDCAHARYCRDRGIRHQVFKQVDGRTVVSVCELAAMQTNLHPKFQTLHTMGDLRKEIEGYFL